MNRLLQLTVLFCLCWMLPSQSVGQPRYSVPGKVYTSLEKALLEPDSVVVLKLRRNKLDSIPPEVFRFKNLRELDLGNNRITRIPANIGELEKLEILNLERNALVTIGKEIGTLRRLRYLDLGMNQIQALPFEVGKLINLEYLQIWGNEITALPNSVSKLENLRWLDMRSIILTTSERESIFDLVPSATEVLLSPDCNCGK